MGWSCGWSGGDKEHVGDFSVGNVNYATHYIKMEKHDDWEVTRTKSGWCTRVRIGISGVDLFGLL